MNNTQLYTFLVAQFVLAGLYIWWYEVRVLRPGIKKHRETLPNDLGSAKVKDAMSDHE